MDATTVNFTTGSTVVRVQITDNTATTRDFLSRLPVTLDFKDFNSSEKIAYPDKALDTSDNQGMTPKVGDLFTYIPWGNIGFFYKVVEPGFSKDLARIGSTDDIDGIRALDGKSVTVEVAK